MRCTCTVFCICQWRSMTRDNISPRWQAISVSMASWTRCSIDEDMTNWSGCDEGFISLTWTVSCIPRCVKRWHCCPVKPFYQHVHLWTLVHRGGSNHTRRQGPSHYVAGSHDYRHGALPLRPDALSACPRQGVSSNHTCLCDMLLSCILSGRLLAVSLHS